jgi:hypothetical protein
MWAINNTTTKLFAADQTTTFSVDYWDTPFTPLQSDIASAGIKFSMKEPTLTGGFDVRAVLDAATAANAASAWAAATATTVVADGRLPNLIGYWAGGAPNYHGATQRGRVAYRFECTLRSGTGRAWFNSISTTDLWLAFFAHGYVRIVKTVGGTPSDVYEGVLTESDFITNGLVTTATQTMTTGDKLDIYYVQDRESWGGFVFKAGAGVAPTSDVQELARATPIIGCGLMDDNAPPSKLTLEFVKAVEITYQVGSFARATIEVPLINPQQFDALGWELVTTPEPGHLEVHGAAANYDLHRHRLIRISGGLVGESTVLFTGFLDDWRVTDGRAVLTCFGFEQRLADQFMKSFPDKISYCAYSYNRLSGTSQPVYDIRAYDNWPMEYALRDLLIRAGIDESRTRVDLKAPKADGTYATVNE